MSVVSIRIGLTALLAVLCARPVLAVEAGDIDNGKVVFEQLCGICHAVSQDGSGPTMGPNLFGLFGRKAASEQNYAMYSPALLAFAERWNAKVLDEFLADPGTRVPGTTMPVMLANSKERADVIAYIASLQ